MKRNLFISNPYVIFSSLWVIVLLLYSLDWSNLYPVLSTKLTLFLVGTITVTSICGYFTWRRKTFEVYFIENTSRYYPVLRKYVRWILILMVLDIIYSGYIPLVVYMNGPSNSSTYLDFGMPFVHIIVVNGCSLLFNCSFWLYRNSDSSKMKKSFLKLCGLCTLQPLLCYSRAQLLFMILGALYIILISNKNVKKTLFRIGISSIIILYLFGLAGDFRQSGGGENYFVKIAGANDKFYRTKIPTAFFWGYIYISSPLANVQNMINTRRHVNPRKEGLENLIYNHMLPGIIKRRLNVEGTYPALTDDTSYLIVEELNVGGIYYGAYGAYKWTGMLIIFLYYLLIVGFSMQMIPYNSILRLPAIVALILITFMQIFNNPFAGDGFIPHLIIAIVLARLSQFRTLHYKNE